MIRGPMPSDQGYVASTWARSLLSGLRGSRNRMPDGQTRSAMDWRGHALRRHGADRVPPEPRKSERDLRAEIGARINAVLDRPDTRALIFEVDRDNRPEMIIGWVLYVEGPSVPTIHYLYTRDHDDEGVSLRGHGIARRLLAHIGVTRHSAVVCTSAGPSSESMRGHFPASAYLPLDQFLSPKEKR